MRLLRVSAASLLLVGVFGGMALNNLWRAMPEFHTLDQVFTVPLYVQIACFVITCFLGLRLMHGNFTGKWVSLFALFLVLTFLSGYRVVVSNNLNVITARLDPVYGVEIGFNAISSLVFEGESILIVGKGGPYRLHTGWYPLGLERKRLIAVLSGFGECIEQRKGECGKMHFNWP